MILAISSAPVCHHSAPRQHHVTRAPFFGSWRWPSEKVTVVSLIGKSTDINGGGKGGAFRNLLSTSVFGGQWDSDGPEQQVTEGP